MPVYENDGADVTIPGSASSFTIDDATVREGAIASFVVKRTTGTGTASVHWELREQGSAAAANADYGYATGSQPQTGDLTFAAGETQKTIAIQTFGDGSPEADETFTIHLSHPANVPVGRADAIGTILNDDYDYQSVSPTVLPNTGLVTVSLRGAGLTSRTAVRLRYISDPAGAKPPVSYTPSDDGLSATAVFDTTGLRRTDPNWYVELYAFTDTSFAYRQVIVEASTEAAKPYVQAAVAPYARGGVTSYSYLHYGNAGKGPSLPAFLRFSGYPAGADLRVDHLPAGASYTIADGIAGRTVMVSVGIAALANDYIRIGYTPTTTIPGHTKLGLQASMSFGAAAPAQTGARTFTSATPATLGAGELFAPRAWRSAAAARSRCATPSGRRRAARRRSPTRVRAGRSRAISPIRRRRRRRPRGPRRRAIRRAAAARRLQRRRVQDHGPLIELEGEYELSIEKLRLTECLKEKGLIGNDDYEDLKRFADGSVASPA